MVNVIEDLKMEIQLAVISLLPMTASKLLLIIDRLQNKYGKYFYNQDSPKLFHMSKDDCDVALQTLIDNGFVDVNNIGNDEDGISHGYEIHLVYGATASPSERQHQTINDSPELDSLSFEFACNPVKTTFSDKPMAHIVIDSTKVDETKLKAFEDILYGAASTETTARLPLPDEVKTLLTAA